MTSLTPQPGDTFTSEEDFATPLEHDLTVLVADLWGLLGQLDPRLPTMDTKKYLEHYSLFAQRLAETGVIEWIEDRAEEINNALDALEEQEENGN